MNHEEYLKLINKTIEKGRYKDTWSSLSNHKVPDWYYKAKFGIFIHWGLYSVPACANEWYSRNMYIKGMPAYEHHIKTYGPQKEFGYKDFIPMFTAEKFDPQEWVQLFREAGAQYMVPVAEHHDGFQMYRSELSHWNAYEMGAFTTDGKPTIILDAFKDETTGIANITTETDSPAKWFDLQGRELSAPSKGLFIMKKGGTTRKVFIP